MKGYLLWDPHSQRCIISKNVVFNEKSIFKKLGGADEAEKTVQGSIGQYSHIDDLSLTSTLGHVQFEVEMGRHSQTSMDDQ